MDKPAVRDRLAAVSPYLLGAVFLTTGTLHFVFPASYDGIIPGFLPHPRAWTLGSGVAELACAVAVLHPRTRRLGGLATAVLLVAVFPANVQMVVSPGGVSLWLALARLPLQVPLVLWALSVRRHAAR